MKIGSARRHLPNQVVFRKPDAAAIWRPGEITDKASGRSHFVGSRPVFPRDEDIALGCGINDRLSVW
jgi:hypothetical protein